MQGKRIIIIKINSFEFQLILFRRYVAAGVFSRCILGSKDCCLDPVVYTRVATMIDWIKQIALGSRSSLGCRKKPVKGRILTTQPKKTKKEGAQKRYFINGLEIIIYDISRI